MKIDGSIEFESLLKEILPCDLKTYYDVGSVDEALKTLPGNKQPAAHCVIFAKTEKCFAEQPLKAFVMVINFNIIMFLQKLYTIYVGLIQQLIFRNCWFYSAIKSNLILSMVEYCQ
jgi:hypothetical protein